MKAAIAKGAILVVSTVVSLLAVEGAARLVIDPMDVLLPIVERDKELGHRIKPNSGGHDAWGFRNKAVPATAEIVAIGDSMTYGISSTYAGSWPSQLQQLSGRTVYNMALGGYGPLQYLHLLKSKARSLKPRLVICAIYVGNDLFDIYNKTKGGERIANILVSKKVTNKLLRGLRDTLARHSVLYRTITQSPLFDFVRHDEAAANPNQRRISGHYLGANRAIKFVDIDTPEIAQAYTRMEDILTEMVSYSNRNNMGFVLTVIPTKATVYFTHIKAGLTHAELEAFQKLAHAEAKIRTGIGTLASRLKIRSIDMLPVLRKAVAEGHPVYPFNDGHPNALGYGLIAKAIFEQMRKH